jgi:hypothetical protein
MDVCPILLGLQRYQSTFVQYYRSGRNTFSNYHNAFGTFFEMDYADNRHWISSRLLLDFDRMSALGTWLILQGSKGLSDS